MFDTDMKFILPFSKTMVSTFSYTSSILIFILEWSSSEIIVLSTPLALFTYIPALFKLFLTLSLSKLVET